MFIENMKRDNNLINIKHNISNIIFITRFLFKTNKSVIFVRIPLLILKTMSSLVSMLFLREILNNIIGGGEIKHIMIITVAMAFSIFIMNSLETVIVAFDNKQKEKTSLRINLRLAQAITDIPFEYVEDPRMKNFVELATSNSQFVAVMDRFSDFISSIINVVTYASLIFVVQPLIVCFITIIIIINIFINKLKRSKEENWRQHKTPVERKMTYFINILSDPRYGKELRVNNLKNYFLSKWKTIFDKEYTPILAQNGLRVMSLEFIIKFACNLQDVLVYLLFAYKVVFENLLIGDFSMYVTSSSNLTSAVKQLIDSISALLTMGAFAKEFRYCIKIAECKKQEKSIVHNLFKDNSIEFVNVSFKYPNSEKYVLRNISFKLNSGEKLSIVGANGAGKSTLVKLLCGFYKPNDGKIFIGGINIEYLSAEEHMRLLAVVFQDYQLFSFSVKENIVMDLKLDDAKLKESIVDSGLENKISSLKNGIYTFLYKDFDPDGIEFSGGEGQKLAIARAIYKNAGIIILDEPTAALDPIAEHEIYKSFDEISKNKTTVYISHRLASTRFTNNILVLSDGQIIEFGSHNELMKLDNGVYKTMFESQAKYYR